MIQEMNIDYMVVDDDTTNNTICQKLIEHTYPHAAVSSFTTGQQGLNNILSNYAELQKRSLILFLDINMPDMDAWRFLTEFKKFPDQITKQVKIFILSSSVCHEDEKKAATYSFVSGFIKKPLSRTTLRSLSSGF